jgi:hypothetical protein
VRRALPIILVAAVALVAGCASHQAAPPKPSVVTIGAPTPATQKITIAGPVQDDPSCYDQDAASYQDCPDSYADPASWPQACDLISKAQLHQSPTRSPPA